MSIIALRANPGSVQANWYSGLDLDIDVSKVLTTGSIASMPEQVSGIPIGPSPSRGSAVNTIVNGTNGANGIVTLKSPDGLCVLDFTGASGYYNKSSASVGQYGHTTYAVVQAAPTTSEQAFFSVGGASDGYQFGFLNTTQRCIRTLGGTVLTTTQLPSWGWEIWTITCDNAHNWTLRVNGIPQTLSASTAVVVAPSASTTLGGAFPSGGPINPWRGLIRRVIRYAGVDSASKIGVIEAMLAAQCELNTYNIICEGNSIVPGGNGTTPPVSWPAVAAGLLGRSYRFTNNGIGGSTTPQMTTKSPILSGTLRSALTTKNYCLGLEFTNDDQINSASTATAQANYTAWINAVLAWGGKPVACTYTACTFGGNPAYETRRQTNCAWLRANWKALGCVGLVDFANDPTIGTLAASANTTLFGDGLHPTPLACQTMGQVAATAIAAMSG